LMCTGGLHWVFPCVPAGPPGVVLGAVVQLPGWYQKVAWLAGVTWGCSGAPAVLLQAAWWAD
jgi:hypothetical protein